MRAMTSLPPLSILDLAPVVEGDTTRQALTIDLDDLLLALGALSPNSTFGVSATTSGFTPFSRIESPLAVKYRRYVIHNP